MEARSAGGHVIRIYDRLYLRWHGLDVPEAEVDPVMRIEVRTNRAAVALPGGAVIRPGERVGALHLNNERIGELRRRGFTRLEIGLRFAPESLAALARMAGERGRLSEVRAFSAVTIFHPYLLRHGFRLQPGGVRWPRLATRHCERLCGAGTRRRARAAERVWITREELLARFG